MRWPRSSYIQWSLRLFSLLGTLLPLLMWSLRLLSLLGILTATPIVSLIAELRVGKARRGSWKKTRGALGTADTFYSLMADAAANDSQVVLMQVYRTELARGQVSTHDVHVHCYK